MKNVQGRENGEDKPEADRVHDEVPGAIEAGSELRRDKEGEARERRPDGGFLQRENFVRI